MDLIFMKTIDNYPKQAQKHFIKAFHMWPN